MIKHLVTALSLITATLQELPKDVPPRFKEPKGPLPYDEEEVTYPNVSSNITLSGTLTLPRPKKPCPAVILIADSGPIDRKWGQAGQ